MRPSDPRIRQTLNHITQNLESANESAQEGIYTLAHNYISPCLSSIGGCMSACTAPCFPLECCGGRDEGLLRRRKRGLSRGGRRKGGTRGRAELNFDFYDDWEWDYDYYDEGDGAGGGLLTWGHDELERLLAGSSSSDQPRRNRRMSYGARRKGPGLLPADERQDPTVIPSSSFLGFLERFPWRIGKRGVRYRPSGADLQENPGGKARMEREPLLEGSDEENDRNGSGDDAAQTAGRQRSATQSSRETSNSMSSRGDLFPSDDEEDAIPLDDEFAMALAPRLGGDDDQQQQHRIARRSTSGTEDSKSTRSKGQGKGKTRRKGSHPQSDSPASGPTGTLDVPTLEDLKREEERARIEEEREIERKRKAAEKLARERGLSVVQGRSHECDKADETPATAAHEHDGSEPAEHTDDRLLSRHSRPHETELDQTSDPLRPAEETRES